jgi:hypothetical protein
VRPVALDVADGRGGGAARVGGGDAGLGVRRQPVERRRDVQFERIGKVAAHGPEQRHAFVVAARAVQQCRRGLGGALVQGIRLQVRQQERQGPRIVARVQPPGDEDVAQPPAHARLGRAEECQPLRCGTGFVELQRPQERDARRGHRARRGVSVHRRVVRCHALLRQKGMQVAGAQPGRCQPHALFVGDDGRRSQLQACLVHQPAQAVAPHRVAAVRPQVLRQRVA